jgi:hypothetical protein
MGRPRTTPSSNIPLRVYWRHGAYHYVNESGKWTRIGKTLDDATAALNKMTDKEWSEQKKRWTSYMYGNCSKNARARGIRFDLTRDDIAEMLEQSRGRCSVTGIFFEFSKKDHHRRRPWVPSIDRMDSQKAYTRDNCRLVCSAVNYAMNEWGIEVLYKIAANLRPKKTAMRMLDT